MIVPGNRALWGFAATVLPASLVSGHVSRGWLILAWVAMFYCLIALSDAVAVVLRGKDLEVSFPPRVNLTRKREGCIDFVIRKGGGASLAASLELLLPEAVASPVSCLPVRFPANRVGLYLSWPVTAGERGVHQVGACRIRVSSPLGFWTASSSLPAGTELHVYPSLLDERKRLAPLLLHRNDARVHPRRQVGQGREFEKLRSYQPGDTLGDVHWRATAKRGQPIVKEFQIERTQEIYAVIDASRLSARRVNGGDERGGDTFLERYLSSSLLLGSIAQRQGDLFGAMTFSDQPHVFIKARSGMGHFGVCREALSALQPSMVTPNFEETAAYLAKRLKRRALLLFLTNLDEPVLAESFTRSIRVLARRHLVIATTMRPAMAGPLFDTGGVNDIDAVYERLGGHLVWHDLRCLKETLKLGGVEFAVVDDNNLSAAMVSRYLDVKRRQQL